MRFQRERIKQAKRNRYALQDGEDAFGDDGEGGGRGLGSEDTDTLTHLGRSLDDFDEADLRQQENEDEDDFGFVSKRNGAPIPPKCE